jgi:hypothetical protein
MSNSAEGAKKIARAVEFGRIPLLEKEGWLRHQ